MSYKRIAQLRTIEQFRNHLSSLKVNFPVDETVESGVNSPLAQPFDSNGSVIGNRFAILPMEGWDGTEDGRPSEYTTRRWQRFGQSGAKLIWGGEAVAVRHDGRANPKQLLLTDDTAESIQSLMQSLFAAHQAEFDQVDDLKVGLQLTHSGRFSRPDTGKGIQPWILYHHPYLDDKFHLGDNFPLVTDDQIRELIADFVNSAVLAQQIGYHFVDLKHCHGYLGHEFLTAHDRPGPYGGSFENRTRFLRELVSGIRQAAPGLEIGVRLSATDLIPFVPGPDDVGQPQTATEYPYAFGAGSRGLGLDLREPIAFLELMRSLEIKLCCLTAGSPYYTPHLIRPALFPPSDGYLPPEDPLVGVARHIEVTAALKKHFPEMLMVGSGYSYLQEWFPNVAQAVVRKGMADFVGLGRMVLSYPQLPADVLAGEKLKRKLFCRTFSDCTTAPRNGIISGCYPLDDFYKQLPEADQLKEAKAV